MIINLQDYHIHNIYVVMEFGLIEENKNIFINKDMKNMNVIWPDNHKKDHVLKRTLILIARNVRTKENIKMVLMSAHNVNMLCTKNALIK